MSEATTRVRLVPSGLVVGSEIVPLYAGSVHYWRLDPAEWKAALQAVKGLGFRLVDTYVPWSIHEREDGSFDFGEHDPKLDVERFLRLAHELGLYAIVRPGPHINAELSYFAIPERIIWNRACQARSAQGNPVMLPMVPVGFPVPSYASDAFQKEAVRYFAAVGPRLAGLRYPDGPIVMVQVDNEGALYFRDGAYDQDYHPDAIALYRRFLREKYPSDEALALVYGTTDAAAIEPPRKFDATTRDELPRHLDWSEFHEQLLAWSMGRFAQALKDVGLDGIPTSHNLPFGQETTPLNPARLAERIDLVALDYYHRAGEGDRAVIARRTTELVTRCEGRGVPAFAAEMGAGFPPFFPPLEEGDSKFAILAALAYGLRGFNLYMVVDRDRWIGAPIDVHGHPRPFSRFYERLLGALERTKFHALRRRTPVRLVTPRSLRRLGRVMHAFGAATGAFFAVLGQGSRERCFEDHLGGEGPIAIEGDAFLRGFEEALEQRGVPFAHVGGEDADVVLEGAKWVVCASTGGIKPELFARLSALATSGARVTLGPRRPDRDGGMKPLARPFDVGAIDLVETTSPADIDREVARAIESLALPTFATNPASIHVTVHEDERGRPRVAFVINGSAQDVVARVAIGRARSAEDAIDGAKFGAKDGTFELRMAPRSIRMLVLEAAS